MDVDDHDHLSDELQPPWGKGYPFCEKCGRPVDSIEIEESGDTGERIYTISCHGEHWRWSNFRGPI
jgi:hypothetical protein